MVRNNNTAFDFTQEFGIHGTFLVEFSNSDFIFPNQRFIHSLGIVDSKETLEWDKVIYQQDHQTFESLLNKASHSKNFSGVIRFNHQNGFQVRMETRCINIIREKDGSHFLVFALKKTNDFSEYENNPDKFFEKRNLLETILDTIEVAVISCNSAGQLTLFNNAATKWHGLPKEKISQEEWAKYYNLYEPDGTTLFKTEDIPLVELLSKGSISKPEMFIKPASGKSRFITCNGARLYDDEKNLTGAVVALYDITERQESGEKLRISEESFRGTFENAANGMSIANPEGKFIEVNGSLCKMLGFSAKELKNLSFLDVTHPDDIPGDLTDLRKLLNGESSSLQKEKRFIRKNGDIIHTMLAVSVVKNSNNTPLELIGQITDISALKIAEKGLKEVLELSTDQNQRLRNFAHIVSHNLRSHSGNFEMLLEIFREEQPDLKDNEVVEMLFRSSVNLKETIAHLNEVAMINTAVVENIHSLNLHNYVDKALRSINVIIQKSGLIVHNNIPEEYNVFALPAYLESIILNFTTNAVKYRSSERQPFLKFSAHKTKDYIELQIEDNGIGINLQKHGDKLFGMYKTFHSHEDARGLGLFITKNQIEAIGGKVQAQSEEGRGTIFTLFFKY